MSALDRFGHYNEFQHLDDPEIENLESADLGSKFVLDPPETTYPTLVLYVSVKRKPDVVDTLKYGLIRDDWVTFTEVADEDAENLLALAKPHISNDLQLLKDGTSPDSAASIRTLRPT